MKDRKLSENNILDALDRIIVEKGFKEIGINAIARESGLSKVLIYRYFGSMEGLLEEWALKNNYWTETGNSDLELEPVSILVKNILKNYLEKLRNDPQRRELLKWLITEESTLGSKIMDKMEESGKGLTSYLKEKSESKNEVDIEALLALTSAGLSYLALIAEKSSVYNGVQLDSEKGWNRIEKTVNLLVDMAVME